MSAFSDRPSGFEGLGGPVDLPKSTICRRESSKRARLWLTSTLSSALPCLVRTVTTTLIAAVDERRGSSAPRMSRSAFPLGHSVEPCTLLDRMPIMGSTRPHLDSTARDRRAPAGRRSRPGLKPSYARCTISTFSRDIAYSDRPDGFEGLARWSRQNTELHDLAVADRARPDVVSSLRLAAVAPTPCRDAARHA